MDTAEPTEAEIKAFAPHLGIDPVKDSAFLWLAAGALCAPVPDGWKEASEGSPFFFS